MKIVVCVKFSLDVSEMKVDPSTKEILLDGVPRRIGDIDKCVIEEGVRLKEKHGAHLRLLSLAPAGTNNGLREAMAMGVDEATIIEDRADGPRDAAVTAEVLARTIERLGGVDLIICGESSEDGYSFQVGPRLAQRLGVPQATYARNLILNHGFLVAERFLEDGSETVEVPLPALVTVTEESNEPRRPTLLEAVKAKGKKVELWKTDRDLGLSAEEIERPATTLRRIETKGIFVERKRILIKDDSSTGAANRLIDYLLEEKVIGEKR